MFSRFFRQLCFVVLAASAAVPAFADRVDDIVRIHFEALGGKERIAALKAMRANGRVVAGAKQMRFTMTAARPDKIRVETARDGRTLVQASDGQNPAWEFDTGEWPPRYHEMAAANAKTFTADAEFDDPLVAGAARGYTFDYAGEVDSDGRKMVRVLVTRRLTDTFALLLDPDTYLIDRRIEQKKNPFGGMSSVVVQYGDYRPVNGVLVAHRIAMAVDGQLKQQTQIDAIEPNPEITPETFSRPKVTVQAPKR